ncbi:hypothetical protein [Vibrio nitrifigilis]|uniref:KfrA N-terminal DNA-binding domain-containing protein n=1 Tax=Vibrio nitrifigilis TaxID=2789781 RepID=A0ABS0GBG9_9VIBR|nr:hypothetical protein [Vibrio nitrifigilis]MBF8998969.1 hypothetical protein [Vibrio nitrifigilis]MBF8999735.1 hypothetical protein [Vibrio nitrifigilis]
MLTKDISDELKQIFSSIEAQGKTPTVALVKARLSSSVPIPAIISAIKSWKSAARIPKVEIAAQIEKTAEEKITQLEQQVQDLTQRVIALEAQLSGNKE